MVSLHNLRAYEFEDSQNKSKVPYRNLRTRSVCPVFEHLQDSQRIACCRGGRAYILTTCLVRIFLRRLTAVRKGGEGKRTKTVEVEVALLL